MIHEQSSRRSFIKNSAAAAGAATFGGLIPSSVLGANDRVNFGIIGTGGQGTGHLKNMVQRGESDNIHVVRAGSGPFTRTEQSNLAKHVLDIIRMQRKAE